MSNLTEWLANLSYTAVIITIVVLIALRFALLKLSGSQFAKSFAEIAESLAIAMGLVFLIIRPFFVQAFFIPSESMEPTLMGHSRPGDVIHDHILVNKSVYLVRNPRPGDVVVFQAPPEALEASSQNSFGIREPGQTDYIKRCIAKPGDTIYVTSGYIMIDGRMKSHDAVQSMIAESIGLPIEDSTNLAVKFTPKAVYVDGKPLTREKLIEYLGGVSNSIVEIHPGYVVVNGKKLNEPYENEDPNSDYPDPSNPFFQKAVDNGKLIPTVVDGHQAVKLGPNQYFMMGDNRNHSSDSRIWGPLDRSMVVGRAMFIFFPFNRIRWVR